MALGEQGLLVSVFPMHQPCISLGLRQKLLARLYSSGASSISLHPQPCYPIMLFTFVPPQTAGALGTGSIKRHHHSQRGSQIPRRW